MARRVPVKFGEQFVVYDRALVAALRGRARRLAEAQLAHAGRLEAKREKLERCYRQQEWAVSQIAIDNIRRAKRQ